MRKIHYSFIGLCAIFLSTSTTVKSYEPNRLFEKIAFIELNFIEDSMLFTPRSKAWDERWHSPADLYCFASPLMNYAKYTASFNGRLDNFWTMLHPKIIDGTVQTYYPCDPATFGFGPSDEGELRFPLKGEDKTATFLTSEELRTELCYLLGMFGPQSDIPLATMYGEDSIKKLDDGTYVYVYPPRDYYWYEDKDIIKYKLRVSILFDKNGIEKKRVIKAICPVVSRRSDTEITGERELLWFNFKELEPLLKKAYYFDKDGKPRSYLNYILQKVKNTSLPMKG